MRRSLAVVGLVGLMSVVGISAAVLGSDSTQAAASAGSTFLLPANDGYGIGDCASGGTGCKVVADSWCEAQGFARSESFGLADPADVTGAVVGASANRPISITCGQ